MQSVKYLCCLVVLCAACRGVRQTAALPADASHLPIAYAVSAQVVLEPNKTTTPLLVTAMPENLEMEAEKDAALPADDANSLHAKNNGRKAQSFHQLKEMAATGELKMSKRDLKILNKLEKKYNGNFEKFRADTFEFTTKAKIIAGVGLIGLLLAITGSWFGAFLFILAALGFILRFAGIIEF